MRDQIRPDRRIRRDVTHDQELPTGRTIDKGLLKDLIIGERRQTGRIIGREPPTTGLATNDQGPRKGETTEGLDRTTTGDDRQIADQKATEDPPRDLERPRVRLEGITEIGIEGGHQTGKMEETRTGAGPEKEVMANMTQNQAIIALTITTLVK